MSRQTRENAGGGDEASGRPRDRVALETFELNGYMLDTAASLTAACDELEARALVYANAHRILKRERAKALLGSTLKTVSDREAEADIAVERERFDSELAEGMMQAELERVRSLRGILSAFQTIANRQKEEAAFDRTGPQFGR